jgi:hypothetical protein
MREEHLAPDFSGLVRILREISGKLPYIPEIVPRRILTTDFFIWRKN